MTYNYSSKISISKAFKEAWKGFKGWWIPLCVASSLLLFSQSWLPKYAMNHVPEFKVFEEYKREYRDYNRLLDAGYNPRAAREFLITRVKRISAKPETKQAFAVLSYKMVLFFGALILLVSILNVVIILMSKFSISDKKESIKANAGKPVKLTPSYLLLAIIKLAAFGFFIIPGVYLYVKLFFTGFILTEESANPFTAMKKSWQLTNGIFWPTLWIFLFTLVIDLISVITVIGFIPGTSFNYTLRASLYKQALKYVGFSKNDTPERLSGELT